MSEENALTPYLEIEKMIISATGQIEFGADAPTVNWAEISEAIDPQGAMIKSADLAGQTFTIRKFKLFESAFPEGAEWVYWCVCENEVLGIFNTVLGGKAVVEELDKIVEINRRAYEAKQNGDDEALRHYISVGAGRRPVVTLERKQGGKYGRYYVLSRNTNGQ